MRIRFWWVLKLHPFTWPRSSLAIFLILLGYHSDYSLLLNLYSIYFIRYFHARLIATHLLAHWFYLRVLKLFLRCQILWWSFHVSTSSHVNTSGLEFEVLACHDRLIFPHTRVDIVNAKVRLSTLWSRLPSNLKLLFSGSFSKHNLLALRANSSTHNLLLLWFLFILEVNCHSRASCFQLSTINYSK